LLTVAALGLRHIIGLYSSIVHTRTQPSEDAVAIKVFS
jgi:hypothetical protein